MATLPHLIFYGAMMRREPAFRKQARARLPLTAAAPAAVWRFAAAHRHEPPPIRIAAARLGVGRPRDHAFAQKLARVSPIAAGVADEPPIAGTHAFYHRRTGFHQPALKLCQARSTRETCKKMQRTMSRENEK
jgi:hypothetical protein